MATYLSTFWGGDSQKLIFPGFYHTALTTENDQAHFVSYFTVNHTPTSTTANPIERVKSRGRPIDPSSPK